MKIAVNTRFLLKGKLEGIGWFTHEIIQRIVAQHPEHEFIFFFDRPFDPSFKYSENVKCVVLSPPARHPLLWYIWFEWSLAFALKRHKVDLFISTDGFLSLRSKTPTLLVIHDLAFEAYPQHLPFKFKYYLKKFTPKFAAKATHIVTVSNFSKEEIIKYYHIDAEKISVVYNGANERYQPLDFKEKQIIKEKYSAGCEYFVFAGALHPRKNIEHLLKAFELFKKRQRSNMKLLIIGRFAWHSETLQTALLNHAFKNDVIHYDYMQADELSKVIGAAYALTFVSIYEGFGIPVLEALRCNVPSIASNVSSIPEVAGEAALYCNPDDVDDIVQQMCTIYKNENLRESLSQKCMHQAMKFSWDQSAKQFSKIITEKINVQF